MKRIICFVSSMDAGGAETFLMKIYRAMDKTHYQFDFIVNVKEKCFYDDEISNLGGYIFYSPMKSQNLFGNLWQNYKIVRRGNYYAALRMTSHSLGTIDLLMARLAGVKKLVLRSTNAGSTGENFSYMFHKVFSFLPRYIPTVKIAPSELAAEYLWGNGCVKNGEVKILHNGIPLDAYKFSKQIRQDKRKELGIEGKFVIGHIGRFNSQKNHKFLIEVFAKVYATNKEARLLLIGKGELENQIRRQVSLLGIRDAVIFAGVRGKILVTCFIKFSHFFQDIFQQ